MQKIISFLQASHIHYEENIDLKKKTWIHRGGICSLFISPADAIQLESVCRYLYLNKKEFITIGHTSNLYFLNTSRPAIIVSTAKCKKYEMSETYIKCEAGVGVIRLARDMVNNGVKGFEYLTGLPGTIGAALINNSSCNSNSISDLLIEAVVLKQDGAKVILMPNDFKFCFRSSVFKRKEIEGVILSVTLKRQNANKKELLEIANFNDKDREKRLGGHSKNLGCTVNQTFSLGRMKLQYYIPMLAIRLLCRCLCFENLKTNQLLNNVLCKLSNCREAAPYISKYNPIVFLWNDDGADEAFPIYLAFMEKVYRTNKLEIQIIQ